MDYESLLCVTVRVFVKLWLRTPCSEAAVSAGSCSLHPHLLPSHLKPESLSPSGRLGGYPWAISPVLQQNIWELLNKTEVQVKHQEPAPAKYNNVTSDNASLCICYCNFS